MRDFVLRCVVLAWTGYFWILAFLDGYVLAQWGGILFLLLALSYGITLIIGLLIVGYELWQRAWSRFTITLLALAVVLVVAGALDFAGRRLQRERLKSLVSALNPSVERLQPMQLGPKGLDTVVVSAGEHTGRAWVDSHNQVVAMFTVRERRGLIYYSQDRPPHPHRDGYLRLEKFQDCWYYFVTVSKAEP